MNLSCPVAVLRCRLKRQRRLHVARARSSLLETLHLQKDPRWVSADEPCGTLLTTNHLRVVDLFWLCCVQVQPAFFCFWWRQVQLSGYQTLAGGQSGPHGYCSVMCLCFQAYRGWYIKQSCLLQTPVCYRTMLLLCCVWTRWDTETPCTFMCPNLPKKERLNTLCSKSWSR